MKALSFAAVLLSASILLAALSSPAAWAAGYSTASPITLGVPSHGWPPYHMPEDSRQRGNGIMPDIFVEAAVSLGATVQLHWLPEKRAMQRMSIGGIDVYTKAKEWVEDPDMYLWSNPVLTSEDVLVFRRGEGAAYSEPKDLAEHAVGTVLGYRYPVLEKMFARGDCARVDARNALNQMRMLQNRRTDVAVINRVVALWLIRENDDLGSEDFEMCEHPLASAEMRFAFNMNRPWGAFIQDMNRELAAMRADGRLAAILARYRR